MSQAPLIGIRGRPFAARGLTTVVVRSREGLTYACTPSGGARWRCGRCSQGSITQPQVGVHCPACHAEVVATQHDLGIWLVALVTGVLVLGWVLLHWWG